MCSYVLSPCACACARSHSHLHPKTTMQAYILQPMRMNPPAQAKAYQFVCLADWLRLQLLRNDPLRKIAKWDLPLEIKTRDILIATVFVTGPTSQLKLLQSLSTPSQPRDGMKPWRGTVCKKCIFEPQDVSRNVPLPHKCMH